MPRPRRTEARSANEEPSPGGRGDSAGDSSALVMLGVSGGLLLFLPLHPGAMVLASVAITFVLVQMFGAQRALREVEIQVAPRRTRAGASFLEQIHVHRGAGWRVLREVHLRERATRNLQDGTILEMLPPASSADVRLLCRSRRRGRSRVRSFLLESRYPLGLATRRYSITVPSEMITEPARLVPPRTFLQQALHGAPEDRLSNQLGGYEFHSLREHHALEDARRVHALRSAAFGSLVRRVERGLDPKCLGLVLDLRRAPLAQNVRADDFEWKLSACTTLLESLLQGGALVQLAVVRGEDMVEFSLRPDTDPRPAFDALAEAWSVPHRPVAVEQCAAFAQDSVFWFAATGYVDPLAAASEHGHVQCIEVENWR